MMPGKAPIETAKISQANKLQAKVLNVTTISLLSERTCTSDVADRNNEECFKSIVIDLD